MAVRSPTSRALVCNFLVNRADLQPGRVSVVEKDPPDALCITRDGQRIGIEVTELISSRVVQRARFLKKQGQPITGLLANWTRDEIVEEVTARVAAKDGKLANAASAYDKIFLAIYTDEPMIDEALARSAMAACAFDAKWINSAFLVLSYHPRADRTAFPNGYPIFPIPIDRSSDSGPAA